MEKKIAFVIPIRHQDNATDWNKLKNNLAATMRSISNQEVNDNWICILVANYGAELPPLEKNFVVKWVNFPPNVNYADRNSNDFYEAVRKDKGMRVASGLTEVRDYEYYMVVDDDDLISRSITKFVSNNSSINNGGWIIRQGYIWKDGEDRMFYTPSFNNLCGTCNIVKMQFVDIPKDLKNIDIKYISRVFGSHGFVEGELNAHGRSLDVLPFPGAIYRINNGNNHSGNNHPLRLTFFNKNLIKKPFRSIYNLTKMKKIRHEEKKEFFGYQFKD